MAHTRVAYTWTVVYDDPLMAHVTRVAVEESLERWLELKPKIYSSGWMSGSPLGLLQIGLTVTHRDQWACKRHARVFARALAIAAHVRMIQVIDPDPASLPPHTHRGRRRIEAPKYQESIDGA